MNYLQSRPNMELFAINERSGRWNGSYCVIHIDLLQRYNGL